jgi:hypothetical protein
VLKGTGFEARGLAAGVSVVTDVAPWGVRGKIERTAREGPGPNGF